MYIELSVYTSNVPFEKMFIIWYAAYRIRSTSDIIILDLIEYLIWITIIGIGYQPEMYFYILDV